MHNSPVTLELCDEEETFPAVRLDRIDVFNHAEKPNEKRWIQKPLYVHDLASTMESFRTISDGI